jgi:hypothetical protein
MKLITFIALLLAGCGLTPTQQKWIGIGASVVITGVIVARSMDHNDGRPVTAGKGCSFSVAAHYCSGQPVGK